MAIAAEMELKVVQLDVKTVFLYATIEEEVFVEMTPGFERTDKGGVQLLMSWGRACVD